MQILNMEEVGGSQTLSNKLGWTELLSCLVCGSHKHVFERRAKLGPQFIEREKKQQTDKETRRSFSSICLCTHTILGTHFQAQTDKLMNVNTQMCT